RGVPGGAGRRPVERRERAAAICRVDTADPEARFLHERSAARDTVAGGVEDGHLPTARFAHWAGIAWLELLRAARGGGRGAGLVDGSPPDAGQSQATATGRRRTDPARIAARTDEARDRQCRCRGSQGAGPPRTGLRSLLAADGVRPPGPQPPPPDRHTRRPD